MKIVRATAPVVAEPPRTYLLELNAEERSNLRRMIISIPLQLNSAAQRLRNDLFTFLSKEDN